MNPSYKVFLHSIRSHVAAEMVCVAMFASEGDARAYALDLSTRPAADGVRITRKDRLVWEDARCAGYRAETMGG